MNKDFEHLFTPFTISGCDVKNRCISRNKLGMADYSTLGILSEETVDTYVDIAHKGVGMIVAGSQSYEVMRAKRKAGFFTNETKAPFNYFTKIRKMLDWMHRSGARVFAEINTGFNSALPSLGLVRRDSKPRFNKQAKQNARGSALSEQTEKVIEDFVQSANVAKIVGYDGVQINLSRIDPNVKFILDSTISESDDYSGYERQLALATDIVKGIKSTCGDHFPVNFNIAFDSTSLQFPTSFERNVWGAHNFIEGMKELEIAGYDAFDVDADYWTERAIPLPENNKDTYRNLAQKAKISRSVPLILESYQTNSGLVGQFFKEGVIDAIGLDAKVSKELTNTELNGARHFDLVAPADHWLP